MSLLDLLVLIVALLLVQFAGVLLLHAVLGALAVMAIVRLARGQRIWP